MLYSSDFVLQYPPSGLPSSSGNINISAPPMPKAGGPIGQTLLHTVAAHVKSNTLNHTLQRTFGPAIQSLNGTAERSEECSDCLVFMFPISLRCIFLEYLCYVNIRITFSG